MINLEHGVQIPEKRYNAWPFAQMKAGDSFVVPQNRSYETMRRSMHYFMRARGGKFVARKTPVPRCYCVQPVEGETHENPVPGTSAAVGSSRAHAHHS